MTIPTVSIGLAVRNEEKYLASALDSLLAQEFKDFEIVISDNASTDRTAAICQEYAKKDSRIRYHRNEKNIGMTGNQNRVFRLSTGEFFFWAGGHDLWHPQFISKCLNLMRADASIALCYPKILIINESGAQVDDPNPCRLDTRNLAVSSRTNYVLWSHGNTGALIYGFIRAGSLRSTGLFRNVICPDNLLLFDLSLTGAIAHLQDPLFYLRENAGSKAHLSNSLDRYRNLFYPEGRSYFRLWLTNWRLLYEHLAAVVRAPVRFNRKPVLLVLVLVALLARRGKHMLHDLIEACGLPRP